MTRHRKIVAGAAVAAAFTLGAGTAALAIAGSGQPFTGGQQTGSGTATSQMPGGMAGGSMSGSGQMGSMGSGLMGGMGSGQMDSGLMGGMDSGQMASMNSGLMGTMGSGEMGQMMADAQVDSEFAYLVKMIPHHEEAITAAQQLLARSDRPEMKAFATSIIDTQTAEADQMKADLANWYPGRDTTTDYTPMMRDLTQLSGDALDKAFLEDMIPHHGVAVMMSQQLLGKGLAQHDEATQLATSIGDGQRAEIMKMMGWIGSWFGEGMHGPR